MKNNNQGFCIPSSYHPVCIESPGAIVILEKGQTLAELFGPIKIDSNEIDFNEFENGVKRFMPKLLTGEI